MPPASSPEVFLLKPGSIQRDSGRILDARSSVTLIVSKEAKIVVDTGRSDEGELIVRALAHLGFRPEEIDIVINTHSHADHCENNHLFPRARILTPPDGETIVPGVRAMSTPGHSLDSISIVIEGSKKVVIAGDALPTFGNFIKNVPPSAHVDRELAVSSMARIILIADIVVPGHDSPFLVRERSPARLPRGEGDGPDVIMSIEGGFRIS